MKFYKLAVKKEAAGQCELDGEVNNLTDPNASKVIRSDALRAFECRFSTLYTEDEDVEKGIFAFKATLKNGSVTISNKKLATETDEAFMVKLQKIIEKYDLAAYNGTDYFVSGISDEYGAFISALYESGERIYAADNQDCFLPSGAMSELIELFSVLN